MGGQIRGTQPHAVLDNAPLLPGSFLPSWTVEPPPLWPFILTGRRAGWGWHPQWALRNASGMSPWVLSTPLPAQSHSSG